MKISLLKTHLYTHLQARMDFPLYYKYIIMMNLIDLS